MRAANDGRGGVVVGRGAAEDSEVGWWKTGDGSGGMEEEEGRR